MQPYPSGAKVPPPSGPALPPPVQMAIRLMWIGAALSAVSAVYAAATVSHLRTAILKVHPAWSAAQVHSAERSQAFLFIFVGVVSVGLWLWMSFATRSGRLAVTTGHHRSPPDATSPEHGGRPRQFATVAGSAGP